MNWSLLVFGFAVTIGVAVATGWSFEDRLQLVNDICTKEDLKATDGVICNLLFGEGRDHSGGASKFLTHYFLACSN